MIIWLYTHYRCECLFQKHACVQHLCTLLSCLWSSLYMFPSIVGTMAGWHNGYTGYGFQTQELIRCKTLRKNLICGLSPSLYQFRVPTRTTALNKELHILEMKIYYRPEPSIRTDVLSKTRMAACWEIHGLEFKWTLYVILRLAFNIMWSTHRCFYKWTHSEMHLSV